MSKNVGRNDPCPCNSGKKYKECHMKPFNPKERFSVKVTKGNVSSPSHKVSHDGGKTWIDAPGPMPIQMRMYYRTYFYPEVDTVMKSIEEIPKDMNFLTQRVARLRHKLYGMKFHMDNFKNQEDVMIQEFNKDYTGIDHEAVVDEPKLTYTLESFLFQAKSVLDVLAQIIGITYKFSATTYAENGDKIAKSLKQNSSSTLRDDALKLAHIVESHKKWVSDLVDMRDEVIHFSDLQGFSCFIRHQWLGGQTADISYPSMPDGVRARTYMEQIFKEMLKLVNELGPIVISSLQKGRSF